LSTFKCEEIIIGGDFNLVLNGGLDKRGGLARTRKNALTVIQNFSENLGLSDVWRIINPEARRYTWRQNQPVIHCRLDFFLASESSLCDVTHANIVPGFKTSPLFEMEYIDGIKTTIENTVNEYKDDTSVSPVLLLEMIKSKVREKSLSFSAYKNAASKKRKEILEREIASLEKQLDNANNDTRHTIYLQKELFP